LWCVFFKISFDMGDNRHHRLHLHVVYASRHRVRLQVLDGLEVIGQVGELKVGDLSFESFAVLAGPLRCVAWLPRFRPDIGARYDGTSDPVEFLQQYATNIRAPGGNGHVMANWFMMSTKGEPRRWLYGLPPRSILS
jgi:hypothetical protein